MSERLLGCALAFAHARGVRLPNDERLGSVVASLAFPLRLGKPGVLHLKLPARPAPDADISAKLLELRAARGAS